MAAHSQLAALLQLSAASRKAMQNAVAAASTLKPVCTRVKDLAGPDLGQISAGEALCSAHVAEA